MLKSNGMKKMNLDNLTPEQEKQRERITRLCILVMAISIPWWVSAISKKILGDPLLPVLLSNIIWVSMLVLCGYALYLASMFRKSINDHRGLWATLDIRNSKTWVDRVNNIILYGLVIILFWMLFKSLISVQWFGVST